jgi:hypothetical protein
MPAPPVVAWRDDGATRSGSTSTAYRVVTNETKRDMPKAAVEAYTDALVRLEDAHAFRAEGVREAVKTFEYWLGKDPADRYVKSCLEAIRALAAEIQPPQKPDQT